MIITIKIWRKNCLDLVICIYNYQNYIALDFSIEFSFTLLGQFKAKIQYYKVGTYKAVRTGYSSYHIFVIYEIYKAK